MDIIEILLTPIDFLLRPVVRHYSKQMRIEREIASDVLISTQWKTITPQPPLEIKKPFQSVSLELQDCKRKFSKNAEDLVFSDGTVVNAKREIAVEILDEYGNKYRLKSGQYGVNDYDEISGTFVVRFADFKYPACLPKDRTYTEVRIRSEKSFRCKKIVWLDNKLK